ncbi:glycosyltransferase family 2 protein [Nonomuraea salmonea]|uniref:glycosyltransferase family 2 protein n=1 Tax=Nonomuraea salmonea TaxID=46181 RepID=UPI002FEA5834
MSRPYVTAIVVAHDGARWLGETLRALINQSRRPDRVAGVDNGSRDGSADLLAQALGPGNVLSLPRSTGFGEAVAEVVAKLPPAGREEWIWLLHDDCAPRQARAGTAAHRRRPGPQGRRARPQAA